ncbi:hypothetical protein H0H93_010526, partial [Arthromyces matolae]
MVHITESTIGRRYAGWFIKNTERTQRIYDDLKHMPLPQPSKKTSSPTTATPTSTSDAQGKVPRTGGQKVAWGGAKQYAFMGRPKSSIPYTADLPPPPPQADQLIDLLTHEIGSHSWLFNAEDIAKMLSPKRRRKLSTSASPAPPGMNSYDTFIEQTSVAQALEKITLHPLTMASETDERLNYSAIVNFLNTCLDNCKTAYDNARDFQPLMFPDDHKSQLLEIPFLAKLRYFSYDKATKDSVDKGVSLQPNGVGILTPTTAPQEMFCSWSRMSDPRISQIIHPLEVKAEWRQLISQSSAYASALFSAAPFRSFALVIGVNHTHNSLRFLIFHSGGLTSSQELKLDANDDLRSIQKVFLSIYSSQTPEDAGLANFTNGYFFKLPRLRDPSHSASEMWMLDEVLYHACCVRGRNTWVLRLKQTTSESPPDDAREFQPRHRTTRIKKSAKDVVLLPSSQSATAATTPSHPDIHQGLYLPHNMEYEPPNIRFQSQEMVEGSTCILKLSHISNSKRHREANVYSRCGGLFGTPLILQVLELQGPRKVDVSNSIFLPPEKDADEKQDGAFVEKRTGIKPDLRTPCLILSSGEGDFLE